MKIFIPVFSFGKGGGNRVLSELANNWVKKGHEVSFLCLADSPPPAFPTIAKVLRISNNLCISKENELRSAKILSRISKVRLLAKAISRYANDADVVLANEAFTAYSVYFSKTKAKKCYYIQADEAGYAFFYKSLKNKLAGILAYFTYKLPLLKIVNSPIYFRYGNIRSKYYIPPGLDYNIFYPNKEFFSLNKDNLVIGCVGRLEKFKGTITVYDAFKQLKDTGRNVKLKVAFGNILDYEIFYRDSIEIVHPKNDHKLADFYRSLDILISPGLVQHNAHHYPVMEAMACRVPTITTGFMPADWSNSWIVGPNSSSQIISAIEDICENQEQTRKKIELAYQNIQVYDWRLIADKFLKLFSNK